MINFWNGQKWLALYISNYNQSSAPPPDTDYMITEDGDRMITEDGDLMITE